MNKVTFTGSSHFYFQCIDHQGNPLEEPEDDGLFDVNLAGSPQEVAAKLRSLAQWIETQGKTWNIVVEE